MTSLVLHSGKVRKMKPPYRRVKRSNEFREEHVCQKPGGKGVLGGEKKQLYQKLLIH